MFVALLTIIAVRYVPLARGIAIIPGVQDVTTVKGSNARFFFDLDPWPTPCPSSPDYYTVIVEFRNVTGNTSLCRVTYHNSTYDNVTSLPCSQQNARMADFDPISAIDGVTFEIVSVTYMDRGPYELRVTYKNGGETVRNTTELTVLVPPGHPTINTSEDGQLSTQEGQQVTLSCLVSRALPGASLRWTRGTYTELGPSYYRQATSYEEFSISEVKFIVEYTDHGVSYICWAGNVASTAEVTSSIALNVTYAARVKLLPCTDQKLVYRLVEGENVHFVCEIDAFPAAYNIRWYKHSTDDVSQAPLVDEYTNKTEMTLRNVSRNSDKYYWCNAQNDYGTSEKVRCEIEVQYGPQIQGVPVSKEVRQGQSVSVTCSASGNPPVTSYVWRKSSNSSFVIADAVLVIEDVSLDDAGIYTCTATNYVIIDDYQQSYSDIASMDLLVLHSPSWKQYSINKFASGNSQQVVLICDVTAYPEVAFRWQFKEIDVTPSQRINITNEAFKSYLCIYGVQEADHGDYLCTASNEIGSEMFTIYLLKPGIPDPPQTCSVRNHGDAFVTLTCVPGYDGGDVMNYYVETRTPNGDTKPADHVTETVNVSLIHIRVTGLHPGTEYSTFVYAENTYGRSEKAAEVSFRTTGMPGEEPPEVPVETTINIAAIIGGTLGGAVLLILVTLLGLYIYWRHEPRDERLDPDARPLSPVPYTVIDDDHYRGDKGHDDHGVDNPTYSTEGQHDRTTERRRATENEYVPHPGLSRANDWREERIQTAAEVHRSNLDRDRHQLLSVSAYQQRMTQSNLAGMGALSHTSQQDIRILPPADYRCDEGEADNWQITPEQLQFHDKLGDGAFGQVWRATITATRSRKRGATVAVKMVKVGSPVEERQAFYKELSVMKILKPHSNVIRLIGYYTEREPAYIVMEYATKGNLQQFLRDNRTVIEDVNEQYCMTSQSLTTRDLVMFAYEVARGMEYISLNKLLHRDLAARNVLLDEKMTCKIGDFGFARDIINCREYESKAKRRLPIRWMAPESLFDNIYSTKSDIWSFGVLLWEIVTFGSSPYPGMSGSDVMEAVQLGYRMDKPKQCSNEIYALMRQCWKQMAEERPDFTMLREDLEIIIINMSRDLQRDLDITKMQENLFDILHNVPGEKC